MCWHAEKRCVFNNCTLSTMPMVTFPAVKHHCPLASTNLYCLATEVDVSKARFPLPELTARVNSPSWRVTGLHYPSTQAVLMGNGNRSPINSGRHFAQSRYMKVEQAESNLKPTDHYTLALHYVTIHQPIPRTDIYNREQQLIALQKLAVDRIQNNCPLSQHSLVFLNRMYPVL